MPTPLKVCGKNILIYKQRCTCSKYPFVDFREDCDKTVWLYVAIAILKARAEVHRSPSKGTFWTLGVAAAFISETAWNLFMLSYMLLDFRRGGGENPPISSLALHHQPTYCSYLGRFSLTQRLVLLMFLIAILNYPPTNCPPTQIPPCFFFLSTSCWINKSWRDKSKQCISRGQKLEREVHAWLMSMNPATSHSALVTTITTSFSCHSKWATGSAPHDRKRISLKVCSSWRSASLFFYPAL